MSTFVTSGFVLGTRPWREGDRLYIMFTQGRGKVELVAGGSKKVISKLAPHLQPFSEVEVMVARGKRIDRLASATMRQTYLKPPYQLNTMVLGTALLEILDVLTRVGEPEPKLHFLLQQKLSELGNLPSDDEGWRPAARWLLASFLIEVLKLCGLGVSLIHCEKCRGELVEPVVFSWVDHGFFHRRCLAIDNTSVVLLPPSALEWFQRAVGAGVNQQAGLPSTALAFLTDYLVGQAGRELYTLRVLRSIL